MPPKRKVLKSNESLTQNKRSKHNKLPVVIWHEIRMTIALRCLSAMTTAGTKTCRELYIDLYNYYHGLGPYELGQVQLCASGQGCYGSLYEDLSTNVTSKKKNTNKVLKKLLTRNAYENFFMGEDITVFSLEKKSQNTNTLMSGRQILDIAKKGVQNYRKALAFASKKWDLKSNTPLESGYTKEDLIDFVRLKMYEVLIKNVTYIDSSDEEGEHDLLDDNINENIKTEENNNNEEKGEAEDKIKNDSNKDEKDNKKEIDVEEKVISSHKTTVKKVDKQQDDKQQDDVRKKKSPVKKGKKTKRKKKKDEDYIPSESDEESEEESEEEGDESNDDIALPQSWFFPGYMAFILWGPFSEHQNRLDVFRINEKGKKKEDGSRTEQRRHKDFLKELERDKSVPNNTFGSNSGTGQRGLSNTQQLQLHHMQIYEKEIMLKERQQVMISLSAEAQGINSQIEAAERRAVLRCPEYDENNIFWKRVDSLLVTQESIMERMHKFNTTPFQSNLFGSPKPIEEDDLSDLTNHNTNQIAISSAGADKNQNLTTVEKKKQNENNQDSNVEHVDSGIEEEMDNVSVEKKESANKEKKGKSKNTVSAKSERSPIELRRRKRR